MKSLLFELRKIYIVVICSFLCFDVFCSSISCDQPEEMFTMVSGLKEMMKDQDAIKNWKKIWNIIGGIYVGLFLYALWLLYEPLIHRWLNNFLFRWRVKPIMPDKISFIPMFGYGEIKKKIKQWANKLRKMKNEKKLEHLDGVIFYGDPGCGKTIAVNNLAKVAGVPLFMITLG